MSPLQKRLQYLFSILSVLGVLVAGAGAWGWWQMRGSLPPLDGERPLAGLSGPVTVVRDSLGVPTIAAASRADAARALGYLHAQDRFFQMDLLRRSAAGELAEIFGSAAVPRDRARRIHGFRTLAVQVVAALTPAKRALLEAYTAGVNAGLAALARKPWEYFFLRAEPAPWRAEDSILVSYAMWLDLQDSEGQLEQSLGEVRTTLGLTSLEFFAPLGNSWDAPLDGSVIAPPDLPKIRLKKPEAAPEGPAAHEATEPPPAAGSNSFALDGRLTASGSALLANDMHLGLRVPPIWYRAVLAWHDDAGRDHRVAGVTLPGTPAVVVGSNGSIAWGFTNAYVDTADVILAETDSIAQIHYRTPTGWVEIEERPEVIRVKGGDPVRFTTKWTRWGPIFAGPADGNYLVLRWNAHDVRSTNLDVLDLEEAPDAAAAIAIAHRAGIANQNFLVADKAGAVAWTIMGSIPRRVGYDGRLPVSWAFGDRRWDGWLKPDEVPVVVSRPLGIPGEIVAPDGFLWTANQRIVGGAALALLGDGGYDDGARARQIRDDLRALVASGRKALPGDLLAIQLDDRAVFLERWHQLLLEVLTDEAVGKKRARAELREVVRQWSGHAAVDSAAYRIVRSFRLKVADRVLAPFFERAEGEYPRFSYRKFHFEDALWRLITEKPARLLNPDHATWDSLLLAAADDVIAEADKAGEPLARFTWGRRNTLRMEHPFSRFLPGPIARLLDMPAVPLPGDRDMPRVQDPDHGASERLVVAPGHENEGLFHMPGGQSGHPLSPFYRAGHEAWVKGEPTPFLPGPKEHTLVLRP